MGGRVFWFVISDNGYMIKKTKEIKMKTPEETKNLEKVKAWILKKQPNICNKLRADETGEFKNFTDEECLNFLVKPWKEAQLKRIQTELERINREQNGNR
jgi:hypothetical protein